MRQDQPKDPDRYRPNVGMALFSPHGLVMLGRRINSKSGFSWQMPQGGIDKGEAPEQAALRELEEETGLEPQDVKSLAALDEWIYYDFPPDIRQKLNSPFLGQRQKWFAFRLTGHESKIQFDGKKPEFDAWRWVELDQLPLLAVPFKRQVYACIAEKFRPWAVP